MKQAKQWSCILWTVLLLSWCVISYAKGENSAASTQQQRWTVAPRMVGDIYLIDLPLEFYQAYQKTDDGETPVNQLDSAGLRVVNRNNEPVPFMITYPPEIGITSKVMNIVSTDCPAASDVSPTESAESQSGRCWLIQRAEKTPQTENSDINNTASRVYGLDLDFEQDETLADAGEFTSEVIVEVAIQSETEVAVWSELARGVIGRKIIAGQMVTQRNLSFVPVTGDLLLRIMNAPPGFSLRAISGQLGHPVLAELQRIRWTLPVREQDRQDKTMTLKLPAPIHVYQLKIALPETNFIEASLNAWTENTGETGEPSVTSTTSTFYHLASSSVESSKLIRDQAWLGPLVGNRWRLDLHALEKFPQKPLEVELGWLSQRLVLLAQGTPPFTVVVGGETLSEAQLTQYQSELSHYLDQQRGFGLSVVPAELKPEIKTEQVKKTQTVATIPGQSVTAPLSAIQIVVLWVLLIMSWGLVIWCLLFFLPRIKKR